MSLANKVTVKRYLLPFRIFRTCHLINSQVVSKLGQDWCVLPRCV